MVLVSSKGGLALKTVGLKRSPPLTVLKIVTDSCMHRASRIRFKGALHADMVHDSFKSSLAFRKPATHADSRCPARTEGL